MFHLIALFIFKADPRDWKAETQVISTREYDMHVWSKARRSAFGLLGTARFGTRLKRTLK